MTEPFWHDDERGLTLLLGDCVEAMAAMDENSVDAICCDPPYGLKFMGMGWDALDGRGKDGVTERDRTRTFDQIGGNHNPTCSADAARTRQVENQKAQAWHHRWAVEALRVLKPGAHLLAFGGSRTHHRLMCALEDAGFEIRDTVIWMYGSGFPKSLDVSKQLDQMAGAEREVIGIKLPPLDWDGWAKGFDVADFARQQNVEATKNVYGKGRRTGLGSPLTAPTTDAAKQWDGWHTALKPSHEPIILARKPLSEPTVAANVLRWGTGALNIDVCRIPGHKRSPEFKNPKSELGYHGGSSNANLVGWDNSKGRWPANLILSYPESQYALRADVTLAELQRVVAHLEAGSLDAVTEAVMGGMPAELRALFVEAPNPGRDAVLSLFPETGPSKSGGVAGWQKGGYVGGKYEPIERTGYDDPGGSAARFFYVAKANRADRGGYTRTAAPLFGEAEEVFVNEHPTVKPVALMQYLVRLITPPGGLVVDPFAGSGTTLVAAHEEGFRVIGIEKERAYCEIAKRRLCNTTPKP